MTYAMALGLRVEDFRRIAAAPRAPLVGLMAQFLILPALTCLAAWLLHIEQDLALAMMLVAACPGGNFSNILTWLARGNAALSVSMTAASSLMAVVMTPLNFALYAWLNPHTRGAATVVTVDVGQLLLILILVLVLPLLLGLYTARAAPQWAHRWQRPMRTITVCMLVLFVVVAFASNWQTVREHGQRVVLLATAHNITALCVGWLASTFARLPIADRRAVTLEVGVHNTGLGLVILFNFYPDAPAMWLFTAFWGVPHLVTGLGLAAYWSRKPMLPVG